MGKFVIKKMKNGEFTFSLKATNGQEILSAGEGFTTLASCKGSIESVKKNALVHVEDQSVEGFESLTHPKFEVYMDKSGEYRFRLKARNGENIGKSEGYKAKESCLNGIASVGKNAPEAEIVEELE